MAKKVPPDDIRCKAISRQTKERCKNRVVDGYTVCRFHGANPTNKGGAPKRNDYAVKTGEHQSIWMDALTPEEAEVLERIDTDPIKQVDTEIVLLTWRERQMMMRIKQLAEGKIEKQRHVVQERMEQKEPIRVHDDSTGQEKVIVRTTHDMVVTKVEETEYRGIDDILRIEEALTRIQDKKLKALATKRQLTVGNEEYEKEIYVDTMMPGIDDDGDDQDG